MTKYTGKLMTVSYNSSSWAANYVKSIDIQETHPTSDSTGAGDTQETQLSGGVTDAEVTVEFWDDTTPSTVWTKCAPTTSSTLVLKPDGTKTRTGTGIVTGRTRGIAYNETVPITVTFKISGGLA